MTTSPICIGNKNIHIGTVIEQRDTLDCMNKKEIDEVHFFALFDIFGGFLFCVSFMWKSYQTYRHAKTSQLYENNILAFYVYLVVS